MKGREEVADERHRIEAAQRDPRHFSELYEAHLDQVYAFVARRVRDRADAEDLTSQVFHQALANIGRFEWRGAPFAAWLVRIASHTVADHFQRLAKDRHLAPSEQTEAISEEIDPEDVERRARLRLCVTRLPADQRRTVVLRFTEDRSIRDVAEALGRSEGAVKQLQLRGLRNLRTCMSKHHG